MSSNSKESQLMSDKKSDLLDISVPKKLGKQQHQSFKLFGNNLLFNAKTSDAKNIIIQKII